MPRLYIGKQYWKAYDNNIKPSEQEETLDCELENRKETAMIEKRDEEEK